MTDVTVLTDLYEVEKRQIHEFLVKLGQKLKDGGIGGTVRSLAGSPGDVACKVAREEGARMILTGTRGLGTFRRTLMGSVSDYILHHSNVPVIVVRKPTEDKSTVQAV